MKISQGDEIGKRILAAKHFQGHIDLGFYAAESQAIKQIWF